MSESAPVEDGGPRSDVDAAVEMMKAGRGPDSVKRVLVAKGMPETEAGALVEELVRLRADQELADLNEQLRPEPAAPTMRTAARQAEQRTAERSLAAGAILVMIALCVITYRPHRISDGTLWLGGIGILSFVGGLLRKWEII